MTHCAKVPMCHCAIITIAITIIVNIITITAIIVSIITIITSQPASGVAFCGRNHSGTVITGVRPSCPSQCVPALTRDNSHCPPALMNQCLPLFGSSALMNQCLPLFVSSGDTHDSLFAAEQRALANHHSCIVLTSDYPPTQCVHMGSSCLF